MNRKAKGIGLLVLVAGVVCVLIYPKCCSGTRNVATADHRDPKEAQISQPMCRAEVRAFLRETTIPKLVLENVGIPEVLRIVNRALDQQTPARKRPQIVLAAAWPHDDPSPRKITLNVHDIPVGMALKYICDQSRCVCWIYHGAVVIDVFRQSDDARERFFYQTRIAKLDIQDANLIEAVDALKLAAKDVDFDGRKPPIMMPVTAELREAIIKGESAHRVIGLHLRDMTIAEALAEICKQAGASYELFEGDILVQLPGKSTEQHPK